MINDLRKAEAKEVFCQENTTRKIFENYTEFSDKSNEINKLFCEDDGKQFITDIYNSFEFDKFGRIVCITIN